MCVCGCFDDSRTPAEAQFYQSFPYRQSPDPGALAWLQTMQLGMLSDEESWLLSLKLEPRNAMESLEKMLMEEVRVIR